MWTQLLLPHIIDAAYSLANWAIPPAETVVEAVANNAGHFVLDPSMVGRGLIIGSVIGTGVGVVIFVSLFLPI